MNYSALRPRLRVATAGVAVTAAVVATLAAGAGQADAATPQKVAYGGNAFGSHVALGSLANVGKTAYTPMCTTHPNATHANKTAAVNLGVAGTIGAVTSEVHSTHSGAKSRAESSTHTAHTVLLANAITLNAVTTTASVTHYAHSYGAAGKSTFLGLTIAGQTFPATPAPNSTFSLPGLGSLTLNGQHSYTKGGVRTMTVTALNLKVLTNNPLGIPGGQIVIGRSTASLRVIHKVASANAYATQINVASVVKSGRTAAVYTPCGATGSVVNHNDLAAIALPEGAANVNVARSTVTTTDTAKKTTAMGQNRIAGVSLFGGIIKIHALTTQANATFANGKRTTSANGTKILGIEVQGQAMGTPKLGQHQSIPGLGTLDFGYARKTASGVVVYGLRIVLGSAQGSLPAGAIITIGEASASVHN